jgi:hypothetical protein
VTHVSSIPRGGCHGDAGVGPVKIIGQKNDVGVVVLIRREGVAPAGSYALVGMIPTTQSPRRIAGDVIAHLNLECGSGYLPHVLFAREPIVQLGKIFAPVETPRSL